MISNLATYKARDLLGRVLWGTAALALLLAVGMAVPVVFEIRGAKIMSAKSDGMEKILKQGTTEPVASAPTLLPHGLATLGVLQAAVTRAAATNGCQLTEFRAGTTIAPYIPRYRREAPDGAWSQMDAHFTLAGRLRDVVEAVQSLGDLQFPVEIDGIELTRDRVVDDGSSRIEAQVELRAISEGAAS